MQIPILSGIAARGADFRTAYPVNLVPVPKITGVSQGYLRPAEGIVQHAVPPGLDRNGYNWNGVHYRVAGNSFVSITDAGVVTTLGTVDGSDFCSFTESFDRMAINGGGKLYYWTGSAFLQVTDPDLGTALDVVWVDGYFMTTDGESLVVTDLSDPMSIDPLKYGSSEINPDPVVRLIKIRNEVYAVNRNTVEIFDNVGGTDFPFARVEGAQIMKGAVGARAACEFMGALAFLGGGKNEAPAIWAGQSGGAQKLSTREIDDVLRGYAETDLASVVVEARVDRGHEWLYIHLSDQTLVFDGTGSAAAGQPVWFVLRSYGGAYRARGFVWIDGKWLSGDPTEPLCGRMTDEIGSHYGEHVAWEFSTPIVYNDSRGAQMHELELVCLTGNVAIEDDPVIATSYSVNGETWSMPRTARAGSAGQLAKRIVWYRQGSFRNWRIQRFQGDSKAHIGVARLEAQMEALSA